MDRKIEPVVIEKFEEYLRQEERSDNTILKYLRDVRHFETFAGGRPVDKLLALEYKGVLQKDYAVTSANSMIAAVNTFFKFMGWTDCCLKQFKVQRQAYCPAEKELTREEYIRLLETARKNGDQRIYLILQTICASGIRVSELPYITVEAVKRGEAVVSCKGKSRVVFLVRELRRLLSAYADSQGIEYGTIFLSGNGKPLSRSSIWRGMKRLCRQAGVSPEKAYPHNLRHLFARTFYDMEKDIAKLADVLGHSSIDTTRIYTITTGEEHRRKMERMNLTL